MDVIKVDRNVVYVAMIIHVCCKLLFSMFHLFSKHMLQVRLFRCCICFTHMFQLFYLDVVYVFAMVSSVGVFSSVSSAFRRMLQVLHLNVLKVDRMLHLPPRLDVSSSSQRRLCIRCPSTSSQCW
jgi:hypothetical protein